MSDDSIDSVYETYYESGSTDGLPVIPPTDQRVDQMLEATELTADTEIGRLGNRQGRLTVETVAVNGVMAGCLPIHMPVLIAGARAQVAPGSEIIEASIGTDSSGHLFLINGPIRDTLDINSDTGAFGAGFRSNQTVGRALGLILQNTAGHHPGEQVMGVVGSPFKNTLVAGENERKTPWDPFHVEQGYDKDENTITVTNVNCFVQSSNYGRNKTKTGILSRLVYNTPSQLGFRKGAVYIISPANAHELRDIPKRDIKQYIYENAVVPAESFSNPGKRRRTPDPDALNDTRRRVYNSPEEIEIVVAGGEGAWNAIMGPMEGGPTTMQIELPNNWDTLLEDYLSGLDRSWGQPIYPE